MGAASAPDPAQPGDGKTAANVTEGQGQPSEPNSQDAGSSASATGTTTAEANAPPPSAPQQPQQEQPQSAQPQGPPPKAEPQPPPRAAPAGSAQGPAAEPMPACHYEVLGVEHNCTEDEIKKAYRDLSKKYHPDKNFGCTDAKERFQRINEAKILLLDRKQRVAYDAKIYTEKLLKKIGADFNQQVQQWVEFTMLQQEGWKVDYVLVARGLTDVLPNHFNLFMRQSGARFMSMHSPTQGVVLIGGAPAMIKRGQDLVNNFVEELNGDRAPADGAVFIVPVQYQQKMPLIANHFQSWMWTYGTQMYQVGRDREGRDRVVIRGTRWPAVVAMLQQAVDFTGGILHMSGQYLDCWRCAHMCELNGIVNAQFISGHLLPPQRDPDKNTVRELFKYVLQLDNQQLSKMSLIDLAVHALTLKQQRQPTCATVRAASSQAVYAEYSQLPAKQSAPLLLAFARLQTSMSQVGSFIQQRFVDQNLQTLQRLGPFLDCSDAMLLRSKGFIAAKEAVPDDAQWHRWDDVLRPDGRLANFWKDLRKFFQQNVGLAKPWGVSTPPADWHTVPDVMCDVLKRCVQGTNLLVDLEKGIFRPKEPSAPAAPPAPKTVAPPLPTGRSTSSASGAATTRAPVEEHLTLVEHAEDVMFELSNERKHDAAAYMELSMATQKLQKRLGQDADKISKNWYSKFELSFDVKQVTSVTSPDHHWVKLTLPGRKRADVRERERRQKGDQKEDFEVVQRILPGLLPKKEPLTSMQEKDFCALLSLLSRETTERCHQDLPKNTLQKLCGGNTNTPELLRSIAPFTMTMVMQAVATLHKRGHKFEEKALLPILRAAALEMHDSDGPPGRLWVPLTVVRDAVLAVCKEPFLDLFKKKHDTDAKLLTTSCALRICTELVLPGTEHLTKLCPPCLSESYGSFRVFAELCGALATLYGAVSTHLGTSGASHQESQVLIRLEEAFGKLANLCQQFCNCISSRDPRGLARLAYAFAKIGDSKHKQNKKLSAASKLGLAQLSKVIQSSDMSKEAGWDMTHLSEIACSYIQEPDQAVYKKIAEAAETLHTDTQSTLKRETLVGFITAFRQTGSMKELYAFLKLLNSSKWFKKNLNQKEVKGLHGEDLVILVTAMVNAEDFETLEELETHLKQDPRKDLDSKHLIDMLKETNACGNQKVKSLGIILQQKIVDAIARRCPPDLDTVLQLCSDERARSKLIDVCSHRDRLERIPKPNEGSAWSKFNPSLESSLAPFVRGKCRAPRLEAAYAGRIMQGLEQCGVFDSPPKTHSSDFAKNMLTAALHFSEDMFASMPALVQTLIQGVSNLPSAREDGEMLKTLVRKMLQVGKVAEKDDALTTWTSQIEDAILKAAGSGIYEMRWNDAELTMGGKDFKQLHTKVKDALGESWLSIILARSRRLSWLPGQPIQFHPPRPRAVLRDLAEKYGEVLGQRLKNEVLALTPEAPAPRSLRSAPRGAGEARSRSREREREVPKAKAKAKAKAAPRAALTVFGGTDVPLGQALEGEYYKDGMNHGKFIFKKIGEDPTGSVDAVFLYYWNGEDCREDLGWWFGDKVGGTEAFMHNPNLGAGSQPPFNGWDKGVKIQPAAFGLGAVKGKGRAKPSAARGPPGPVPPAKRPREEEERHVRLKQWLTGLDEGKGDMLAYYEALKEEFDGDLTQIAAARIENNPRASPVEQVEPTFWEAIKCTKGVHRLKFARGIISLPAS